MLQRKCSLVGEHTWTKTYLGHVAGLSREEDHALEDHALEQASAALLASEEHQAEQPMIEDAPASTQAPKAVMIDDKPVRV